MRSQFKLMKFMSLCLCALLLIDLPATAVLATTEKQSASTNRAILFTTNKAGQHDRSHSLTGHPLHSVNDAHAYIQVLPHVHRQTFTGVGGALTDSAASVLMASHPQTRQKILRAYFGQHGAQYTNLRLTIGSSDFSTFAYTYATRTKRTAATPNGFSFSLKPDDVHVTPVLKAILRHSPNLRIMAAPWAPPAWMKVSQQRAGHNFLSNNSLRSSQMKAYAAYLVDYVRAQKQRGVNIKTLSLQNELQGSSAWEAMTWTPDAAAKFITDYLGPQLRVAHLKTHILVWDYVKSNQTQPVMMGFNDWTNAFYAHREVQKYVCGVGVHWYAANLDPQMSLGNLSGQPTWDDNFPNLDRFHQQQPRQQIIATEATQERGTWLHSWTPAARYGYDIIHDYEHHVQGYIDWNLVLNGRGGPTHAVSNPCSAPINVLHAGTKQERVVINPAYYVLKRVSCDSQPGTVSVASRTNQPHIAHTAILQQKSVVNLLLSNDSSKAQVIQVINGHTAYTVRLTPHSFNSIDLPRSRQSALKVSPQSQTADSLKRLGHLNRHWLAPFYRFFGLND
ncbi:MAG TPA: hypothetical protein DCW31_01070 [Lactobacillus sp.]|nr:hypothetical protein [Lactobacillus sp.]